MRGSVGHGRLDRGAIERLAAMDSVASIEMAPQFAPAVPKVRPAS